MLKISNRDFKITMMNMLKDVVIKVCFQEQIGYFRRAIETIKKSQVEMNNSIPVIKNFFNSLTSNPVRTK